MDKQALYEAPDITVSYSYERSTDLNRGFLLDQNSASTSLDLHMDHRRKPVSSSGSVVEYTEYNNPSSKSSTPCEGMNCRKHVLVNVSGGPECWQLIVMSLLSSETGAGETYGQKSYKFLYQVGVGGWSHEGLCKAEVY
ncbi:hypothetical protein GN956_G5470 [Arapaima gigas]